MGKHSVLILMGSDSDATLVEPAWQALAALGVAHQVHVASAHRSPKRVAELVQRAADDGCRVIIAAAGAAAHLAGVVAAHTTLPVIALPVPSGTLGGLDALLASAQMPAGVPVATVGIGGARNAGLMAAAILALADDALATRLEQQRRSERERVLAADARLQARLTK